MAQNSLQNIWPEKTGHAIEEDLDDSSRSRKNNIPRRRNFMNPENETFYNSIGHGNDNSFASNVNLADEPSFQRRNRSNRFLDEVEYETTNLNLNNTTSSDTLHSKVSRHISRSSPPGSYRSIRNSTNAALHSPTLHSPKLKKENKDGINIIMLVGFAIGIFFGTILNISEVYFIWFQLKITEMQAQVFDGRTIHDFYVQEGSIGKKILCSPLSALFLILQSIVYVVLISLDFLKRPAPKKLVSNIMTRYVNE